jgi:mRNA-degrading endonuclease RelE of RelBE toxin-antitoxin system
VNYHLAPHREARKFLERSPAAQRERIVSGLRALEVDRVAPRSGADIKKLHGTHGRADFYRVRNGRFRAVYRVEGVNVLVTQIWERGHGYDI